MAKKIEYEKSLLAKKPALTDEWDYDKNVGLRPEDVAAFSHKKVWWKCGKGHTWQARIQGRSNGNGCPYCNGSRAIPNETDFFSLHPELMNEWHWQKNKGVDPRVCSEKSGKSVWWKCSLKSCGYEWKTRIADRSNGRGCPSCGKKVIVEGRTDFASLYPDIAREWAYERNNGRVPERMPSKSNEKVWWQCSKKECGQYWKSSLSNRSSGAGCPYCAGKRTIPGKTDFATLHPELMIEWNHEKNQGIYPSQLRECSEKKVWWKCSCKECGQEWIAAIKSRTYGQGCPYCSGNRIIVGKTDFETLYPDIAKQWDYDLNDGIFPNQHSPSSHKKAWWKCSNQDCKMSWQSSIAKRTLGRGCPYCSGHKVRQGKNDLATCFPELLFEWDYKLNNILPNEISASSSKYCWWECQVCEQSWKATITNRTYKKSGCPYCAGKRPIIGENDFATLFPELLHEWAFTRNGDILPENFTIGSARKVWWQCSNSACNQYWKAPISSRTSGNGCPYCSGKYKKKSIVDGISDVK